MAIRKQSDRVTASARESGSVTPSDSTELSFDALYIGSGGTLVIKHEVDRSTSTFVGVLGGQIFPVTGVRVMAATTAANIVWMRW